MKLFKYRQFSYDIIIWAVPWYCKYGISYRELVEMLGERGINVEHSTIYLWVQRYAKAAKRFLVKALKGLKSWEGPFHHQY